MYEVKLLHKDRDEVRFILQRVMKEYSDVCYEADNLRNVLDLCRVILEEMVKRSESGMTKYALHHETLREDARKVLPLVLEALK